ncbi:MAG: hypothetical protein NT062_14810 [Proteobacteria bacterium]|nr:hypothetical protein [Pseudomonadota bacterium]
MSSQRAWMGTLLASLLGVTSPAVAQPADPPQAPLPSPPSEPSQPDAPVAPPTPPTPPTVAAEPPEIEEAEPAEPPHDTTDEPERADDGLVKHKKTKITHKPGKYVEFRATDGSKYRLRLTVQPMMRFVRVSTLPDLTVNSEIRRARLGFDARLARHVRLKWEIQIKNMHFGLSNLYGTYAPSKSVEIYAGLIKAPGGLERDSYSFNEPFIERSVVAGFTYDHEVGVKVVGKIPETSLFYAGSLTRTAPFGVDGGDPEDKPVYPANVEPDDISLSSSKWNTNFRFGTAPSRHFETSISGGTRFRTDLAEPDFGDRVAEPYDSGFVEARPYYGVGFHVAADAALSEPHFRLMMEGGVRRDGQQLAIDLTTGAATKLDGNLNAEMGYLVFGWTPGGHYGKAEDNAELQDGWELVTSVEGARIKPVDVGQITFVGLTTGIHWEVTPSLRLQADFGYQKYSRTAEGTNVGGPDREYFQLWGTWRI